MGFLIVFIGSGIGGALRHGVGIAAARWFGSSYPFGTLAINVAGSFVIGLVAGWFALRGQADQSARLFLTTGVLGGFTTYSAFALESAMLWQRGQTGAAFLYVAGTITLALLAVSAGLALTRSG